MGPDGTMGLELFGLACIVGLMSLRIWIQWGRRGSRASYAYDICLGLAFCCNAYITSIDVWSSYRQTKLGPDPPNAELNKKMMDKEFLRVCTHEYSFLPFLSPTTLRSGATPKFSWSTEVTRFIQARADISHRLSLLWVYAIQYFYGWSKHLL
jgi:hypothetical protein